MIIMPCCSRRDKKIYYNDPHDISTIIERYVLDAYKTENIRVGSTIIDFVARLGEFTLLASELVGSNGKVVAIELSPDDFIALKKNLSANGCSNVVPVNMAAPDEPCVLDLKFKGRKFNCEADSLKSIIIGAGVDHNDIDFIKMNIEGSEKVVIPLSIDLIKSVSFPAMEIHEGYHNELIPIMERLGFGSKRITKKSYIKNIFKFTMKIPHNEYTMLHLLKQTTKYPGVSRIIKGINI